MKGKLILLLHAHLPYVLSHGRWPHGVDWVNEACAETYIPLLRVFEELSKEGYTPGVTLSLSPTVCEMLSNDEFVKGFEEYLSERILASERELSALSTDAPLYRLALMWLEFYTTVSKDFRERYNKDLLGAFRRLQEAGSIEVITTCATHGYLPLLSDDGSIRLQIKEAVNTHRKHFGTGPVGMWLPECAYRPEGLWHNPITGSTLHRKGIERFLEAEGIRYIFLDTHMLVGGNALSYPELHAKVGVEHDVVGVGSPRSPYKVFSLGGAVYMFTRDPATGVQVWSSRWGYPGDGSYLEFHKKSFPAGLRYWRVTHRECGLGSKALYDPDEAARRAEEHATHFVGLVDGLAAGYYEQTGSTATIAAPYDAELFGHWWYEGPLWLRSVIEGLYRHKTVLPTTARSHIDGLHGAGPQVEVPEGSWGDGGDHKVWLNDQTRWIWRCIYSAESVMRRACELSRERRGAVAERILKQMARELLLLESSDWPFLVTTATAEDYAEKRVETHFEDLKRLAVILERCLEEGGINSEEEGFVSMLEERDNIFRDMDISSFEEI